MGRDNAVFVSLCMIVKNEERLLPIAIQSAEGLANEIVVVDTGSDDATISVAQKLGATVVLGADSMNKAAARNAGLDAAHGDWIVVMDADETIVDPVGFREYLYELPDSTMGVYIQSNTMNAKDEVTLNFQRLYAWRRGAYRYKYRAHEVPVPQVPVSETVCDFVWEHRPPPERTSWKLEYTLNRLLLDVAENLGDPRPLFYLGRQYVYMQLWQQGIDTLTVYLKHPDHDEYNAWGFLGQAFNQLGMRAESRQAMYMACVAAPERREPWCVLAENHYADKQYAIAAKLLRLAISIKKPNRGYVNPMWYNSHIHDLLARALWNLKQYTEGREQAKIASDMRPEDKRLAKNLLWFESALGDADAQNRLASADKVNIVCDKTCIYRSMCHVGGAL